jgi:hypothetical protein
MAVTELAALDELFEQARRLPHEARRELRDRLDQSLEEERVTGDSPPKGPYASLLKAAGTAHSLASDVARNKKKHLAEVYMPKRIDR